MTSEKEFVESLKNEKIQKVLEILAELECNPGAELKEMPWEDKKLFPYFHGWMGQEENGNIFIDGISVDSLKQQCTEENIKDFIHSEEYIGKWMNALVFLKGVVREMALYKKMHHLQKNSLPIAEFLYAKFHGVCESDPEFQVSKKDCDRFVNRMHQKVADFNPYQIKDCCSEFENNWNWAFERRTKDSEFPDFKTCDRGIFNGYKYGCLDVMPALRAINASNNSKEEFSRYYDFVCGKILKFRHQCSVKLRVKEAQLSLKKVQQITRDILRSFKNEKAFRQLPIECKFFPESIQIQNVEYKNGKTLDNSCLFLGSFLKNTSLNSGFSNSNTPTSKLVSATWIKIDFSFDSTLQLKEEIKLSDDLKRYEKMVSLPSSGFKFFACMRDVFENPGKLWINGNRVILKENKPQDKEVALKGIFAKKYQLNEIAKIFYKFSKDPAKECLEILKDSVADGGSIRYKNLILGDAKLFCGNAYDIEHKINKYLDWMENSGYKLKKVLSVFDKYNLWKNSTPNKDGKFFDYLLNLFTSKVAVDPISYADSKCEKIRTYARTLVSGE